RWAGGGQERDTTMGAASLTEPPMVAQAHSQRAYARLAGFMYLFIIVCFAVGQLIGPSVAGNSTFGDASHRIAAAELLYRIGLLADVVGSLATIPLIVALYVTLRPIDRNLALMAALFRVIETAADVVWLVAAFMVLQIHLAASHANGLDVTQLAGLADLASGANAVGFALSAAVSTLGSSLFFYLFLKSKYIPSILAVWGIFGAVWFTAVGFLSLLLPQLTDSALYGFLPILIAELSTGLWLLIVGIKLPPSK
ncbi:MAG TPA: DUF4386 domain-containing protein, partial [Ktedonobacterales bacterium]|nr:DUF4386 domain-containing protein [Ktedonobacterales bacterium]